MKKTLGFVYSLAFVPSGSKNSFDLATFASLNLVQTERVVLVIKPEDASEAGFPKIKVVYDAILMGYQEIEDPIRKEFYGQWLDILRGDSNSATRFAVSDALEDNEGFMVVGMKKVATENGVFILRVDTVPVVLQD